jgi:two-component system CheB/CheR fusion protein
VVLTLVDITKRRLLERQVVNTTEKVRRQIGQDLHDILSSDLTALAMMLDNYRDELEGEVDVDVNPLKEMSRRVQLAADRARTLSHALVPMELQEKHLAAALESLCRAQDEMADLTVTFEGDHEEPLPHQHETAAHLYRIAKEAIVNARRHAEADHVRVRLRRIDESLELIVRDDGTGIPDDLPDDRGLGLRTMRYRANLIGATLSITSGPSDAIGSDGESKSGTTIRCTLPLQNAEEK